MSKTLTAKDKAAEPSKQEPLPINHDLPNLELELIEVFGGVEINGAYIKDAECQAVIDFLVRRLK